MSKMVVICADRGNSSGKDDNDASPPSNVRQFLCELDGGIGLQFKAQPPLTIGDGLGVGASSVDGRPVCFPKRTARDARSKTQRSRTSCSFAARSKRASPAQP